MYALIADRRTMSCCATLGRCSRFCVSLLFQLYRSGMHRVKLYFLFSPIPSLQ